MVDWRDYVPFDLDDFSYETQEEIQNLVQMNLDDLQRAIDLADSESELEMALADLEYYSFDYSEAEQIELDELTDYMSSSYKYDIDKINRYLELTGQGGGGFVGGGGGGGGISTPTTPPLPEDEEDFPEEEFDEYYDWWNTEYYEYVDQIEDFFRTFF